MGPDNRSIQRLVPVGAHDTLQRPASARPLHSLEPRGVGAILDAAFEILRARFGICMLLAVPLWIPVQLIGRQMSARLSPGDAMLLAGGQMLLTLVVQSLVVGVVCQVVYDELQGRVPRTGRVLTAVLRRGPALLLLTLATALLTLLGLMCCVLPSVLAAWLLMVAPAALMLEDLGPFAAMRRSSRLMSRGFRRWLGVILTQMLLLAPLNLVATLLIQPGTTELVEDFLGWPPRVFEATTILLTSSLLGLATAFTAVVMTLFYLDSRVRLEGFDLHMRFERLREGRATR